LRQKQPRLKAAFSSDTGFRTYEWTSLHSTNVTMQFLHEYRDICLQKNNGNEVGTVTNNKQPL